MGDSDDLTLDLEGLPELEPSPIPIPPAPEPEHKQATRESPARAIGVCGILLPISGSRVP